MPDVSERVVHQRVRNRVIEQLENLAEGDAYLQDYDLNGYINDFFDWMPLGDHEALTNLAMTSEELVAVEAVRAMMDEAINADPAADNAADFIANGWPIRIAKVASEALTLLMKRGRFSESSEDFGTVTL